MASSCLPLRWVRKSAENSAIRYGSTCESIRCPCRTHCHFQAGGSRCCSQVRIDQSCCAKGAQGSPSGRRSSGKGNKTQGLVCKEAGYLGGEPQGLSAAQHIARHQSLATTPNRCPGAAQPSKFASPFGREDERLLPAKLKVSFPLFGVIHAVPVSVGYGS